MRIWRDTKKQNKRYKNKIEAPNSCAAVRQALPKQKAAVALPKDGQMKTGAQMASPRQHTWLLRDSYEAWHTGECLLSADIGITFVVNSREPPPVHEITDSL